MTFYRTRGHRNHASLYSLLDHQDHHTPHDRADPLEQVKERTRGLRFLPDPDFDSTPVAVAAEGTAVQHGPRVLAPGSGTDVQDTVQAPSQSLKVLALAPAPAESAFRTHLDRWFEAASADTDMQAVAAAYATALLDLRQKPRSHTE